MSGASRLESTQIAITTAAMTAAAQALHVEAHEASASGALARQARLDALPPPEPPQTAESG